MKKLILAFAAAALSVSAFAEVPDWANHPRYAADNAALTQAPEVVFMGNSITDGWDDHHPEFFTDNNFACRGISGQVSGQMLCRFYSDVVDLKPKAVVILAGVNDVAGNQGPMDPKHIVENVFSMCEIARQHGIRPLIASNLPTDTIPWNPAVVNAATYVVNLNTMLKDYADANGITYVDYYSVLTTPEGALNPAYTNDRLHPTRAGYDLMEPVVLAALKEEPACCKKECAKHEKKDCTKDKKDCKKGEGKHHKHAKK